MIGGKAVNEQNRLMQINPDGRCIKIGKANAIMGEKGHIDSHDLQFSTIANAAIKTIRLANFI